MDTRFEDLPKEKKELTFKLINAVERELESLDPDYACLCYAGILKGLTLLEDTKAGVKTKLGRFGEEYPFDLETLLKHLGARCAIGPGGVLGSD